MDGYADIAHTDFQVHGPAGGAKLRVTGESVKPVMSVDDEGYWTISYDGGKTSERILDAAKAAGAREAGYVLLRLPLEVKDLVQDWLLTHHPDKLRHVMSLIRSTRGGKDYDSQWGQRMVGSGPYAWMIGRRFEMAAERLGFNSARLRLRTDLFVKPEKEKAQLSLF